MKDLRDTDFLEEINASQGALFCRALVLSGGKEDDAWEILQEANLYLMHHAGEWRRKATVLTWGKRVLEWKARELRQNAARHTLKFPPELQDAIYNAAEENLPETTDDRLAALRLCLAKLKRAERNFIVLHYVKGLTFAQIALREGMKLSAVCMRMKRLRDRLAMCIRGACATDDETEESAWVDGLLPKAPSISDVDAIARQFCVHALLCIDARKKRAESIRRRKILWARVSAVAAVLACGCALAAAFYSVLSVDVPVGNEFQSKGNEMPIERTKTVTSVLFAVSSSVLAETLQSPASTTEVLLGAVNTHVSQSVERQLSALDTFSGSTGESAAIGLKTTPVKGTVIYLM